MKFLILHIFWLFSLVRSDLFQALQLDLAASEAPGAVIPIHNANLLILSQPKRDHFTLVVLTSTDEKHECKLCMILPKILRRVASIWYQNYPLSQYLYFAEIDIVDRSNVEVFNYLQLQTVPQIWLIPPSHIAQLHNLTREQKFNEEGEEYFDNYDILLEPHAEFQVPDTSLDKQVFEFADWLAVTTSKRVVVNQENPLGKFATTFGATFGCILLLKKKGPSFITLTVTKGKIYQVMTFATLLAILGGYSFVTIQRVPFVAQNEKNQPIYISGGIHWQFGVEMILVAFHYLVLGIAMVTTIFLGTYRVTNHSKIDSEEKKAILQILSSVVLFLLFSSFTSMFTRKDPGYPYPLLSLY